MEIGDPVTVLGEPEDFIREVQPFIGKVGKVTKVDGDAVTVEFEFGKAWAFKPDQLTKVHEKEGNMSKTPEELVERFKENPDLTASWEEADELGRDEYRRYLDLLLQTDEGRRLLVDWLMSWYDWGHLGNMLIPHKPSV